MKRFLSSVALVGLGGLGLALAAPTPQTPSTTDSRSNQTPSTTGPDSSVPQAQADATSAQQSAHAFEGRIQKSGNELVLQENMTRVSYKLDDQNKAKRFEGKDVKVMATMDPSVKNRLHVVDITRLETQ